MSKFSAKYKIYIALFLWLVLCGSMFGYFFGLLNATNKAAIDSINSQNGELKSWTAERDSYKRAQTDLQEMSQQSIQPDDFFGKDITLVNEIKILEGWANRLGLVVSLSGISGTIKTLPKAKTSTSLAVIPYSITLQGPLDKVVAYMQVLEHLSFVTTLNAIGISTGANGNVSATLTSTFYIHK